MSTRSQIGFYEKRETPLNKWEVLIYRHSDGYPEGVLPDIIPFLKWWKSNRGISDLEYCAARLLQWLCNEYDGYTKELEKKIPVGIHGNGDYTGTLGHGISKNFHGDIEYVYAIYPNGVKVYSVTGKTTTSWKLLIDIDLDKKFDLDSILKQIKED